MIDLKKRTSVLCCAGFAACVSTALLAATNVTSSVTLTGDADWSGRSKHALRAGLVIYIR